MRKLTRKKSRRETRTLLSDLKNGTLRRSNSAELISEVGDSDLDAPFDSPRRRREGDSLNVPVANRSDQVQMYRGLRISDRPSENLNNNIIINNNNNNNNVVKQQQQQQHRRVRHNSDGNYDDINLMQETILSAAARTNRDISPRKDVQKDAYAPKDAHNGHDSIYENLMPLYSTDTRRLSTPKTAGTAPPPVYPRKAARQLNFAETKIRPPLSSDTSSIDSHNDSGYSTRIAVSEGPSPPLIDGEPLLDPQALYMIPPDMVRAAADSGFMKENSVFTNNNSGFIKASDSGFINYEDSPGGVDLRLNQVVINPKSSFV